jgi:hypothetical protein
MIRNKKIGEKPGNNIECYGIVDVTGQKDGNGAYLARTKMLAKPHTLAC